MIYLLTETPAFWADRVTYNRKDMLLPLGEAAIIQNYRQ